MDEGSAGTTPSEQDASTSENKASLYDRIMIPLSIGFFLFFVLCHPSGFDLLGKLLVLMYQPVYGGSPPLAANASAADMPAILSNAENQVGSNVTVVGRIQNIEFNHAFTWLDFRPYQGGTIAIRVYPPDENLKIDQCLLLYGVVAGTQQGVVQDTQEKIVLPAIHAYKTDSC